MSTTRQGDFGEVRVGNCTYDSTGKLTGHVVKLVPQYWDAEERNADPMPVTADRQFPHLFPRGLEIRQAYNEMNRSYFSRGLRLPRALSERPVPAPKNSRFLLLDECSVSERELMALYRVVSHHLKQDTEESCLEALELAFKDYQVTYVVP